MSANLDKHKKNKIISDFPRFQFPAFLGISVEELDYSESLLKLKIKKEITQGMGYIHGGAISALCDTSVGIALATMVDDINKLLTVEFKINFLAPADEDVTARAKIIYKGRRTAVGESEVRKKDGTIVAKSLFTFYIQSE